MGQLRLYSANLEAIALRSIMDGGDKVASWILPRLSRDHFSFEPTRETYRRMSVLISKSGNIPRWDDMLEDLIISQDAREELRDRKTIVVRTKSDAKRLVDRLDQYRRARSFFHASRHIARKLKSDSVDLDQLGEELADMLSSARGRVDVTEGMLHVGDVRADMRLLREMFSQGGNEFIPTGIRAFDSENQGVPRGSAWLLAATTSGGKSLLALQVAIHQALLGARVCVVSLEMSKIEMLRRMLAHIIGMPMSRVNRAHDLGRDVQVQMWRAWKDLNARIRKNGGRLTIVCPEEDLTIEELLTLLKPYAYDVIFIDYLGLLKGLDGDEQWRRLGAATRYAKRFAGATNSIVAMLAQLSDEGAIRYSKTIKEHASLMWQWTYSDEAVRESRIMTIKQPKARNLKPFDFYLRENFSIMRLEDIDPSEITGVAAERKNSGRREVVSDRARRKGREAKERVDSRKEHPDEQVYRI